MSKRLLICILSGFASVCAQSQEYEGALWSLPFLTSSSDAVSLSLGSCSLTGGNKAFSSFDNPAGAAFSEGVFDLAASAGIFEPGKTGAEQKLCIGVSGFVSEKVSLGFAVSSAVGNEYGISDGNGFVTDYFKPGHLRIGMSAAWKIFPFLSLGASASFFSQDLSYSSSLRGFALGAAAHLQKGPFEAVIAGRNLLSGLGKSYPTPSEVVAGAGWRFMLSDFSLKPMAEASFFTASSAIRLSAGLEAGWKNLAHIRLGGNYGGSSPLPDFLSAGLGGSFKGVSADVSYVISNAPFGNSFLITISYKLDKKWKSLKEEQ